jgi:hypothetical protein
LIFLSVPRVVFVDGEPINTRPRNKSAYILSAFYPVVGSAKTLPIRAVPKKIIVSPVGDFMVDDGRRGISSLPSAEDAEGMVGKEDGPGLPPLDRII